MSTANGNGTARRTRQVEVRTLTERYYNSDNDWSCADLWREVRTDYYGAMPSQPSDRKGGANWPVWRNESDLDRIRGKCRLICETNPFGVGLLENLVNHIIGKGFTYRFGSKENTAESDPDKATRADYLKQLKAKAQDELERCWQMNRWDGKPGRGRPTGPPREFEILRRLLRDGEVFLRYYVKDDRLIIRFIEPEQVRNPTGAAYADGWSFGIQCDVRDAETVQAYHFVWIDPTAVSLLGANLEGEEVDVAEVEHLKGPRTDSTIRRGASAFAFGVAATLERARVLSRNNEVAAAVKAAIAETWQHATGTSSEISTFRTGQADHQETVTKGDGSTATRNVDVRDPGTVRDIPQGMEAMYPGPDNAAIYIQVVQAALRAACAAFAAPEYFTADASNGTYAGLKEAGAPFVKYAEAYQVYLASAFARVAWRAIEVAVDAGRLPQEALTLLDLQVEPATVYQRDRLQVAQESQILNMLGALSPQTICMEAGRDYEVESANIQQHQERFGQMGTPLGMSGMDGLPKIPDTHGMGDDAGGALHGDDLLATQQPTTATPGDSQADAVQGNDLRTTVGVLNAVASLQSQFYAGKLPREAAISNVMLLFGFTPEEAGSLFPEIAPQKLTPDDALAGPEGGGLGANPFAESVLEANSDSDGIRAARNRVLRALDSGEMKQGKCESCGATETEAHHADYRKPLDVTWLCRECHDKRHGKVVEAAGGTCKPGETSAKTGCTPAADTSAGTEVGSVYGHEEIKTATVQASAKGKITLKAPKNASEASDMLVTMGSITKKAEADVARSKSLPDNYPDKVNAELRYLHAAKQYQRAVKLAQPFAAAKESVATESCDCSAPDCPCPTCKQKRGATLLEDLATDFPDETQDTDYSCGAAAFTAVARYFGLEPDTESEAIRALRTSIKDGTDPEHIVAVATDHGLEAIALSCRSIDQLRQQLDRGRPAICAIQAWGTPTDPAANNDGHYVVALAVDDQYVTIMDPANFTPEEAVAEYGAPEPANGQKVRVPLANFVERWHDTDLENVVYDRYAVILWKSSRPVAEAKGTCGVGQNPGRDDCVKATGDAAKDEVRPYDPSMTADQRSELIDKLDAHIAAGGDIPDEVFDTFPQQVQTTYWQDLKKNREPPSPPAKSKYEKLPEVNWRPRELGYVYRVQPVGATLHGQSSETSAGNTIKGVFVFDNLNELAAIDWMNDKNVELLKIKTGGADLFHVGDQEGVGLKKGKGKVVARTGFEDVHAAKAWAIKNQKRDG